MKSALFAGLLAIGLAGCAGVALPVIPVAPTVEDAVGEQTQVDANVAAVCDNLDANEANLKGWIDLADLLGGAFGVTIGDTVVIPSDLVKARGVICD